MTELGRFGFVASGALIAFVAGVACSDSIAAAGLFRGDTTVRCLGARACVGMNVDEAIDLVPVDEVGGVSAEFCGPDGAEDMIELPAVLRGATCSKSDYIVEFRNQTTRTLVKVRAGKVIGITRGPPHVSGL
jgi:hypothetical protein